MLPKPVRAPRERKPLRRSKPIPRRSGKARRKRTPQRIREVRENERIADGLWRLIVRADRPLLDWFDGGHCHHLKGRGRRVRWDPSNGIYIPPREHELVTRSPLANRQLGRAWLGRDGWEALERRAKNGPVEDPADAVVRLRAEVVARGLERQARERGLL